MYCGRHYLSRNAPSLLSQESGKAAWNLHPPRRYIPPGGQLATNAFALLTGKYFPFAKIQCALFKGTERVRNRIIADIFSRMEIIEEWGTGIRRILHRAKEYGLPEPEFMEIGDTFRVNLFKKADKKPIKTGKKADKIFLRQRLILDYIEENGFITNKEAREILGLADSTTKRFLKYMVETNLLLEKGQRKSRKYIRKSDKQ